MGPSRSCWKRYNKCIAAGGDYLEGGQEFHVCTINKSAQTKKSLETYLMISVYVYSIYILCVCLCSHTQIDR